MTVVKDPLEAVRKTIVRIVHAFRRRRQAGVRLWRPKTGDPYDYAYPHEFLRAFSRTVDFRNFRKYETNAQKGTGDHVMDINVVFVAR